MHLHCWLAPNKWPRVDAEWAVLFAFSRAWPRATQAERIIKSVANFVIHWNVAISAAPKFKTNPPINSVCCCGVRENLRKPETLPRYVIKVHWLNWIWPDPFHLFDIYDAPLI